MKRLICLTITSFLFFANMQAQLVRSAAYSEIIAILKSNGWSISEERYGDARQSNTIASNKMFYASTQYLIYAFSEDDDVRDVDISLFESDGNLYASDASSSPTASLKFTTYVTREMKVVVKNYRSLSPGYASRLKFVIAYR